MSLAKPAPPPPGLVPAKPTAHGTVPSMQVFRRHLVWFVTGNEVCVDATGINSKACYDEW